MNNRRDLLKFVLSVPLAVATGTGTSAVPMVGFTVDTKGRPITDTNEVAIDKIGLLDLSPGVKGCAAGIEGEWVVFSATCP